MLKNAHNIPARKFGFTAENKQYAIYWNSSYDPGFGGFYVYDNCDIAVRDNCNTKTNSYTWFGYAYINDTALDRETVFKG
jgi:hypothetical protein